MRRSRTLATGVIGILSCITLSLFTVPAWAEPGDEDLGKAVEAKLTAENFNQLADVVKHCQDALNKGLSPEDEVFAKRLMASALIQRATVLSRVVFEPDEANAELARQTPQILTASIAELEAAVSADPEQPDAFFLLGRLHLATGADREKTRKEFDEALRLYGDDSIGRVKVLIQRASVQEKPDDQLADYNKAVEIQPNNVEALRSRGSFLLQVDRLQEALADFNTALTVQPDHASTLEARGVTHAALNENDKALTDLNQAIKISPQLATPYAQRARVHSKMGNSDLAMADLNMAIEKAPQNTMLLVTRAQLHHLRGDADAALKDVTDALHVRPNQKAVLRIRSDLLASLGRFDEAISDLNQVIEMHPQDTETYARLGMLHLALNQYDQSIAQYNKAIALNAEDQLVLQGRGDALNASGKQVEALADYTKALSLDPQNPGVLNNMAWVLATSTNDQLRDGKRAVELATEACKLTDYKQPNVLSTLAAAYAEQGDFPSAIEWSSKALEASTPAVQAELQKELDSFRAGKPWREATPATEKSDAPSEPAAQPAPESTGESSKQAESTSSAAIQRPFQPRPSRVYYRSSSPGATRSVTAF